VPWDNTCDHVCEEPGECRLQPRSPPPVAGAASSVISSLPRGLVTAGLPSSRRTSTFVARRICSRALSRWCGRRPQPGHDGQDLPEPCFT
jgi:hypothetical protein